MRPTVLVLILLLATAHTFALGADPGTPSGKKQVDNSETCLERDESINVPQGFCIEVVAENLGPIRHIVSHANGDLYARLLQPAQGGGIVALRDTDGNGSFDRQERFFDEGGTGIGIWGNYLYFSTPQAVYRQKLTPGKLSPTDSRQVVVSGFPSQGQHAAKPFAFSEDGDLFVNVGAPSNACQKQMRTRGSPGLDPCPQLKEHAGIWRFAADQEDQTFSSEKRYASGIRNAVALAWNPVAKDLYAVQHGRDQLHQFWPDLYSPEENARLPAEEFFLVNEGDDFGWPYCYYDQIKEKKVLAPEYGGNGQEVGRCKNFEGPIAAFPGHWAPNGLLFYTGNQFPDRYIGGAFIAFHGSWNRAPLPQQGYKVVFVPFDGNQPADDWTEFATGFPGQGRIERSSDARCRPMGLAESPDGSLFISDSRKGRIWKVRYLGAP